MNRWVAAAAVAGLAAGCGNYSTEDLRFLVALPRRDDLRVAVPANAAPAAGALTGRGLASISAACPTIGDATVWQWAKPTSDGLNAGVDWVIGLVDAVRKVPPTAREEDYRRWGPFDADDHPGREIQVVITRSFPAALAGAPRYAYVFEARWKGTGAFLPLVQGEFDGASATSGKGWVDLRFDNVRLLAMHDADSPDGVMSVQYDRVGDPRTTDLTLATGGFGVVQFSYGYAGYRSGAGAFDYAFRNFFDDLLEVWASYDGAGAGRLRVRFTASGGGTGYFNQCWDAAGCLVYVDDPVNFTASCGAAPCLTGDVAACATVPVPPFPVP